MILSPKEIALIKCLRGKVNQLVIVKARDGDLVSVDRIETSKTKENSVNVTVEKKEKLYPV